MAQPVAGILAIVIRYKTSLSAGSASTCAKTFTAMTKSTVCARFTRYALQAIEIALLKIFIWTRQITALGYV
jgi:hypothetical protein